MEHTPNEHQQFVEESYPVSTGYPIYAQAPTNLSYPIQNAAYLPNYGYPTQNVPVQGQPNGMLNNYLPQFKANVNKNIITTQQKKITLKVPNCLSNLYDKVMERKGPKESIHAHCTSCSQDGMTKIESKVGAGALTCTGLLCCCCPALFWCPLVVDECYDHQHNCQNCGAPIMKEKFLL